MCDKNKLYTGEVAADPRTNQNDVASDGKYDSTTEHQRVREDYVKSTQTNYKSTSTTRLRARLQEEAKYLQDKLKSINFVLENLTPELEQSIKVINTLNELGHYLR